MASPTDELKQQVSDLTAIARKQEEKIKEQEEAYRDLKKRHDTATDEAAKFRAAWGAAVGKIGEAWDHMGGDEQERAATKARIMAEKERLSKQLADIG